MKSCTITVAADNDELCSFADTWISIAESFSGVQFVSPVVNLFVFAIRAEMLPAYYFTNGVAVSNAHYRLSLSELILAALNFKCPRDIFVIIDMQYENMRTA